MEFQIYCLTHEGFNDTDIAFILGKTVNMVERRRSDTRKKVGAKPYSNIHDFFLEDLKKKGIFIEYITKKNLIRI
jgi:hypothetical protein